MRDEKILSRSHLALTFARPCQASVSFDLDEFAYLSESRVAQAAHHYQVFGAAEVSVLRAVRNDTRGKNFADARQPFNLICRRRIEVDARPVRH
jgi:hypothetical protein